MSILKQMFTVFVLKVYFLIIGEEVITKHLGEIISLKTTFGDTIYDCVCQEITFKTSNGKLFGYRKVSRLYRVSMKTIHGSEYTHDTYPILCSDLFRFTKYPHMLAIKSHYQYYYM